MPSRSIPTTFSGATCIESARYGFVHGPSPAVAEVTVTGRPSVQVGEEHAIQMDQSLFYGFVTNIQYDYENDASQIRMVDWRDRMRDEHVFAAYNMSEESGLWYHIEQENWKTQQRTWVNQRWLEAVKLQEILAAPDAVLNDEVIFIHDGFKTSWSILNKLADQYNIQLIMDEVVEAKLKTTIPENVDGNQGMFLVEMIEYVVQKASCQFACYGQNLMVITMRGLALAGMGQLIRASLANPCNTGAHESQVGTELNERGRRVRLLGDRNQYEWVFPCTPDWNPRWTWQFTFTGVEYSALLLAAGLVPSSKMSELPVAYHDLCYWPLDSFQERQQGDVLARRTRNDLTLEEYRSRIPYKTYRVCTQDVVRDMQELVTWRKFQGKAGEAAMDAKLFSFDKNAMNLHPAYLTDGDGNIIGIDDQQPDYNPLVHSPQGNELRTGPTASWDPLNDPNANAAVLPNPGAFRFPFPLSPSLVTNTFKQFTPYGTAHDIPEGWAFPFSRQRMLVPLESGVSLQIEETPPDAQFKRGYILRVVFQDPQFLVNEDLFGTNPRDPSVVEPDRVFLRLSFDREIYEFLKGELGLNFRVREKKVQVRHLYKGYVQGKLQPTIRQMQNWANQPRDAIAKTDDVADGIATKLLANQPITISGGLSFEDRAGFIPDGLIDTVSVDFNQSNGLREQINFTSASNVDDSFVGPSRIRVQRFEELHNEIIRDRDRTIAIQAMRNKDAIAKIGAIAELGLRQWGGFVGDVIADKTFGRDGVVHVNAPDANIGNRIVKARGVLPIGKIQQQE